MTLIIIILVVFLLLGGWGFRSGSYTAPGGLLGVLLLILLVLWLTGNLHRLG
jgi:hypothetical protein